jgi:ribokinase
VSDGLRVGVVGHTEWVELAVVARVPRPGEILEAAEVFRRPGGGGGVAAVQLRRMAGHALFLTALGIDGAAEVARRQLGERYAVEVHAATREVPQRRAFTHLDAAGERTITVLGERIVPHGDDDLPWERIADLDAVYFTGGDAAALRRTRAARVVVATPRASSALATAGVQIDALVASSADAGEDVGSLAMTPPPRLLVLTEGAAGGRWEATDGTSGRWAAAEPPGPPVDAFGCGDTFAAGLTYALGAGRPRDEALAFAARCGAHCLAGRGPYGHPVPAL